MQVTIFGANGKVGSLITTIALDRGLSVVAFSHKSTPSSNSPKLIVRHGDIYNEKDVLEALSGSSIVISALGSWHTSKKNVLSIGMEKIIPAMQEASITRIISLTGADARASGDELSFIHKISHAAIKATNGKIMRDAEIHISLLEKSMLDWTVLRSPVMNESGRSDYRLTNHRPKPWQTINRHAVALSMVDLVFDNNYSRKAPYISR